MLLVCYYYATNALLHCKPVHAITDEIVNFTKELLTFDICLKNTNSSNL